MKFGLVVNKKTENIGDDIQIILKHMRCTPLRMLKIIYKL